MRPITQYQMPARSTVPPNVTAWRPDPDRSVVLVHDMQEYFLRPFPPTFTRTLLDNVAVVLERARAAHVPIVFSAHPGRMSPGERGLLLDLWGQGMSSDPTDTRISGRVAPRPGEPVLTKWRYSAFYRTDLHERVRDHARDQLVVVGVFAHLGVLFTATDAMSRGLETFVVGDATGDLSEDEHLLGLRLAATRCAAVTWTKDVVAAFDRARTKAAPA